ncbi:MAG TPA: hypothetical protein VKA07_00565 [Candidatus Sulfotelmatobacter sp.]|nr:hypothetical protein [Candidatus Sulfotelmatobacter sp.]
MTDYSAMNYDELRRIADNDSVADSMSEAEYEALSVELWRKFGLEKIATGSDPGFAPAPAAPKAPNAIWSVLRETRS